MKPDDDDEGLNDLPYEEVLRMWDEGEPVELGAGPFTLGVVTLTIRPKWLVGIATVDSTAATVAYTGHAAGRLEGEGFTVPSLGRRILERTTEIGQKLAATG